QLERNIGHAVHQGAVSDQLRGALEADRLVVTDVGLGARREDGLRQPLGLTQALWELDPRDAAAGLVVLPARARDVSADHALDREHLEPADDQGAPARLAGN